MSSLLRKVAGWLLRKFAAVAVIVLLWLAACGFWLFVREQGDLDRHREAAIAGLSERKQTLTTARDGIESRLGELQANLAVQRDRELRAEKVIALLRDMESWWDRVWGNPAQQKANAEQIKRMEEVKAAAKNQVAELMKELTRTRWEKDGVEIELGQVSREISQIEESKSKVAQYAEESWREAKRWLLAALGLYFLGPTLWALAMYFGLAPLVARGRPIQFQEAGSAQVSAGKSDASVEILLGPAEVLRIKGKFLTAAPERARKSGRSILGWRFPLTSAVCGLKKPVEVRTAGDQEDFRVTLSNANAPQRELAVIDLPEGASLILRPGFLAGVIQRGERPLVIRRHWRIFRWQAWATGQFRFFEFVGPCRLVVAGSRSVRAEELAKRAEGPPFAQRTTQAATIGFAPTLSYRPVRAENFWNYYRGKNALFDDLFAGHGIFLWEETASPGATAKAGGFWLGFRTGGLRMFGI